MVRAGDDKEDNRIGHGRVAFRCGSRSSFKLQEVFEYINAALQRSHWHLQTSEMASHEELLLELNSSQIKLSNLDIYGTCTIYKLCG